MTTNDIDRLYTVNKLIRDNSSARPYEHGFWWLLDGIRDWLDTFLVDIASNHDKYNSYSEVQDRLARLLDMKARLEK